MANPIYEIQQRLPNNEWGDVYEIGALFSNVRDDDNPTLSLKTIMDHFLTNANFIYYGETEPFSQNVKVWYDTTPPKQ